MSRFLGSRRALFGRRDPITASYLVVGGGGGGGNFQGGGGGAGGFLTGTTSIVRGVTYTVTVGAGGAATGAGNTSIRGGQGGNSVFGAITALGGGGGGAGGPNGQTPNTGGSGGGGYGTVPGSPSLGAAGTAGQGFAGGNGALGANYGGGGGGGAGAVGLNGTTTAGAAGGAGLASSITGVSVTYAGGGGGGIATPGTVGGAGGAGGGGAGAGSNVTATSGTANTGGGGGGGYNNIFPSPSSGAGGSGVVILSIPTAQYNGFVTGTAVTTISGSNTILTFTGSGTVTFPRLPALTSVFAEAAAAYAVRIPANSTYYGPLIRVRRSNDNAELDIYPVATLDANGNRLLDTTALLAFTGANNGFVTTWYDQSGNARHATQTLTGSQPSIVNAGSVSVQNGVPIVVYGIGKSLFAPTGLASLSLTMNAVGTPGAASSSTDDNRFISVGTHNGTTFVAGGISLKIANGNLRSTAYTIADFPGTSAPAGTPLIGSTTLSSSQVFFEYKNGTQFATGSSNIAAGNSNGVVGQGAISIHETMFFRYVPDISSRLALERNQGTAYGITVA